MTKQRFSLLLLPMIALLAALAAPVYAQSGGELRFCLRAEPKTFNPIMVEDEPSETVRYLTGGILIRVNRRTQQLEPELATSWKITNAGRTITFKLRPHLYFSDGTPFSADDVAYTIRTMMDPDVHAATGDTFRSGDDKTPVVVQVPAPDRISITYPAPIAGLEALFDQVAIMSAKSPHKERAVMGPFYVADHKPGAYILLNRNPNYWKRDSQGRQLPYLATVRLDIQQNRELELMRFRREELHLINSIDGELYDRLSAERPGSVRDIGGSLDAEQLWFNMVPSAPIPDYKKVWFKSKNFRRAISEAINRNDMARVVFGGHATPAFGPTPAANHFWFNKSLKPYAFDQKSALSRLRQDGFNLSGGVLRDSGGHAVEFSIITNAGNKGRERMAAMIQQDLAQIGIKVNVVSLDFPSLIERITRTFNYEGCILGQTNVEIDPNSMMNVWLSSGATHPWYPEQKSPATAWEAEIDRLMRLQASSMKPATRKQAWDKVQQIVYEEAPVIYLVNKNALAAVAPSVASADPVVLRPQTYWNIEYLSLRRANGSSGK